MNVVCLLRQPAHDCRINGPGCPGQRLIAIVPLMPPRRILTGEDGSLRLGVLLLLALGSAVVVLALAALGGWGGVAGIAVLVVASLVAMIVFGDGTTKDR